VWDNWAFTFALLSGLNAVITGLERFFRTFICSVPLIENKENKCFAAGLVLALSQKVMGST
jgi:hypothetical protein